MSFLFCNHLAEDERAGLEVIKLEFILKLKYSTMIGCLRTSSQILRFILSLKLYSSFITLRPGCFALIALTYYMAVSLPHGDVGWRVICSCGIFC